MSMSTNEISLIAFVRSITGQAGRLYYYQGNFYYPFNPHGSYAGKIKRAIREFRKTHADLIKADRADPSYRTLLELFDMEVPA